MTHVAVWRSEAGRQPLAGLSFYTWNAAEFLALLALWFLKKALPARAAEPEPAEGAGSTPAAEGGA